ncbi:MAG: ABC transporter permease [Phycisphaerae bacterium]|nr:ABC transporter permease [Phycisphaerae bacterium]
MTQTIALFIDAYRDLNSRKLFWLALIISALVVVVVGAVGIDETGFSVFGISFKNGFVNTLFMPRDVFYKLLFSNLGVKFWLAWLATILALVSTASMIPDLVASGSIDMMLSKPMSRTRLFLTRWSTGLLFVALQSTVFVAASFLVIGIRGGAWEPALFLAVPVLVVFFSYLFCVCALVGLLTRSTIASLIVTLIFWVFVFCMQAGEGFINNGRIFTQLEIAGIQRVIDTRLAANPDADVDNLRAELASSQESLPRWEAFYWPVYGVVTCLPKTAETTSWLERRLVESVRLQRPASESEDSEVFRSQYVKRRELAETLRADAEARKGVLWVIGSSLGFEVVVLAVCVWLFRRRDF